MRKLLESNRLLLCVYACLLLSLASFFIFREQRLSYLTDHKLPFLFLVRFGAFWFVSFMLAIVFYLAYLSYQPMLLKKPDKVLARRLGFYTFWLGIGIGVAVLVGLYLLYKFPYYFNI
ncbi:hypothetical protein WG947_03125 [Pontibacter sp. H259]|uniref:hypothetical protein n=1 Tax=Pontibacter sp. H259 TaxID=3133421 RepID=UPI0030BC2F43